MHTGSSIWEVETFLAPQDFIIIGGGLAGLWCALELKKKLPSASITILEKGSFPSGASTRNAGFACIGSPTEMIADLQLSGAEQVFELAAMRYNGIQKIRQVLGDAAIDYDPCGGYECLTAEQVDLVNHHLPALNEGLRSITGQPSTFTWNNTKMDQFGLTGFDGMIENIHEGGLHSGKLVQQLTRHVQRAGVQIITGVDVKRLETAGNGVAIHTRSNHQFKAAVVIHCTNAFVNQLVPESGITPARGQLLLTAPIENLRLRGTFHFDEGYYYFRDLGERVLLGGARNQSFTQEQTTEQGVTDTVQLELERFLSTHILKDVPFTIERRWSGIMGFTLNKMPLLKQVSTNTLLVNTCNGMGVALSPIIAEKVAELF